MKNETIPLRCGKGQALALLAILLTLPSGLPAPALAQSETFEEATSVVVIEVPVQVVDRDGTPIRSLRAENFEILDGRQPREIIGFDVIDRQEVRPEGKAERPAEVPPAARRHFLFLFDLSFSNPSSILRAREAARQVLDDLHPSDLSAVATFTTLRGAEMVLGFTTDRRQTALAIDTLGAPQLVDRSPDPLGLMLKGARQEAGSQPVVSASGERGSGDGGAGAHQQDLLEYLQDLSAVSDRMNRAAQLQRVQDLTRSMAVLGGLMRSVDGRKYVVYLSEGFDSNLLLGEGGGDEETRGAIESGELWTVDTDAMYGSGRLQNQLEAMLEELRRADCTIQAVDIGGLRAEGEGPAAVRGQDGLFAMARGTGGELYRNFNDLGDAMGQMLERTSVTYVLAFQPQDLQADGDYHKLRVRLKNVPQGARVVHRPGYFAPRPLSEQSAGEQRLQVASQLLTGREGGGVKLSVLAVPVPVPDQQPAVSVFLEIDGSSLLAGSPGAEAAAEIYTYALDSEGAVADYFSQTLGLDLAKLGDKVRRGGVRFLGQLDLDPGRYDLRVLVRNAVTGRSGIETVAVEVPEFGSRELVVLPPLVPEMDYDRWLMVRQTPAPGDRQVPYPFTLDEGKMFVPVAHPLISAGRPMRVGVFAYNAGPGELTVNAELHNDEGYVVLGQQLPVHQRLEGASGDFTRLLASLQVAGVADGEYTLTVGLFDREGSRRDLASIPVRVAAGSVGAMVASLPPSLETLEPRGGRDSARIPDLRSGYRRVLAQLSEGFGENALQALVDLEIAEAAQTDDVLLSALQKAQMEVARRLAAEDPDALTPVILLHMDAYLRHRDDDRRLLARHSRSMVRDLAELYVDAGGSPTSVAADVFTSLGGSLQQSGLTTSANTLFERALDLEKDNEGALLALACYYEKVGEYERSVSYLERLVKAHSGNPEAWLRLSLNLERLDKKEQAAPWLVRAMGEQAPPWIRTLAYQEMALLQIRESNLDGAEKVLRQGLERWPSDQRLRLQLAHVLDRRGRPRAAASVLAELDASPPGAGESPRYVYNSWPRQFIESGHLELVDTASSRLPALAKVISGMSRTESAR